MTKSLINKGLAVFSLVALVGVAACSDEDPAAPTQNIVELAQTAGNFTTLVTALEAADLVGTLTGEGPFTVFAPTDAAFAALPAGALDGLLADVDALTDVLLYHVASGQVLSTDLGGIAAVPTLQGQALGVDLTEGVKIGGATVTQADLIATNGVIHVIDAVLLPTQ